MTCKEKFQQEHPECIGPQFGKDECKYCPHDYGYLPIPDYCSNGDDMEANCARCWNREIPETESVAEARCVQPNWEGMYEKVSAENADLKLKLSEVTDALKKSYREVEILRGMIRVVESFNGEPILRYIKNKSENEVMVV